ncbi:MAG: class I SAM-dependent methyltransferase [Crocinitomicaceae bacterium]|nr:class I SAM-dependent methyltransferase [Crocinitomicaceae bacterium]
MSTNTLHIKCIKCGSADLAPLTRYSNSNLTSCKSCDFIFCKGIPSEQTLLDYYENNYQRTNYFSPITRARYNHLLDKFESKRKTNRILDIGCGHGFFLEVAKERGWEVYGTELSNKAIEDCELKEIQMHKGRILESTYEENTFDIVVSIEMIEHINYPKEYVKIIQRILRKGGQCYITTPNFNSLLRYYLKEKYDVIEYPNHLCYYTKKSLSSLFHENGLKPAYIKTTGLSFTRFRTSKGKSNQEYVSETSDDEMVRYKIEKNGFLRFGKKAINGILNLFKVGDSIKASFIKD